MGADEPVIGGLGRCAPAATFVVFGRVPRVLTVDCVTRDREEGYDEDVDDDPQEDDEAVERWPIVSADVCGGRVEPQPMLRPWSLCSPTMTSFYRQGLGCFLSMKIFREI